jgi:large subunit ribosomal protein L2
LYRKIDFLRIKLDLIGHVRTIEYDPNRNAQISLVYYIDGRKGYIISPSGLKIGQSIVAGFRAPTEVGNALPLWKVPLGTMVHNLEIRPGFGGQVARSAGTSRKLLSRASNFSTLRFPSGAANLLPQTCWTTVGEVGNAYARKKELGKAGVSRWLGFRPEVRGSAINPVDHPQGGGEGRCPVGHAYPITPWGKPRLGTKTRCKKKHRANGTLRRRKALVIQIFRDKSIN